MAFNNGIVYGSDRVTSGGVTVTAGLLGIREELADYIAVVDQKSTPFVSMAPKGKDIGNMQFSWQVDNYSSPVQGGTADGTDATVTSTSNASANRARLYNFAQVFRRLHRTGFIQETMNVAGVTSETARAVSKRLVEIKRDMEASFCCSNQTAVAEATTPAGSVTGSLGKWMNTTVTAPNAGAPTSTFAPASGAVDTTNTAVLTETNVQAVLTAIYGNTGVYRDYDLIAGTTLKRAFTNLTSGVTVAGSSANNGITATSVRTFNTELTSDVYKSSIDVFEGDFGTLRLHPSTFINGNIAGTYDSQAYKGYVLPMEMCEVRYAKLPEVKELPDSGGGPIRLVQAIAGLVVKNPSGMGMFNAAA